MSEKSFDIGVIGGGASGLASAIYASTKNSRVAIFEKNERVGKKILVTGNSRCNLSNKNLSLSNYFGDHAFIKKVFDSRSQTEVMSFFDRLGIEIEITEDGRMFPASFQASSVLDALRFRCEEQGVTVITGCEAMSVKRLKEGFEIESSMHDTYFVKKVIISTGGLAGTECSSKKLFSIPQSLGHTTVEAHSSLVQLHLEGALFKSMEGNRWICKAMVVSNNEIAAEDKNEVLFTNYGVSGSAVLNVSRFAVKSLYEGKKTILRLDILPDNSADEIMSILNKRKNIFKERETDQLLNGWINKRIGQTFLKAIGFDLKRKIGTLTDEELEMIQNKSHSWDFSIISDNGFKNAQVMSGGISTDEIDPSSMESKIVKGIYFAGETCNVEGKSGGYNLHWAWISGMTAGESAQKSLI